MRRLHISKCHCIVLQLFMCCLLNIQNDGVLNDIELDKMFSNVTELATTNSTFWSNELIAVLEHSRKNKCLFNPSLLKPAFANVSPLGPTQLLCIYL